MPKVNEDALIGQKEAAAFLKMSEDLISDLCEHQGMPYMKYNGRCYFEANDLAAWYRGWCARPHPNQKI